MVQAARGVAASRFLIPSAVYFSNGIECEDFRRLKLDQLPARQALLTSQSGSDRVAARQRCLLRNRQAEAGTTTFLSAADVSKEGVFVGNDLRGAKPTFGAGRYNFVMSCNYLAAKAVTARK